MSYIPGGSRCPPGSLRISLVSLHAVHDRHATIHPDQVGVLLLEYLMSRRRVRVHTMVSSIVS
jgi:hypothetical protein